MKRIFSFGFLLLFAGSIVISCQKETSVETNQDLAQGSLHDSTDECYPIKVNGAYYNGVNAARESNTVMLYVNVTKPGEYAISSSTENGITFTDSGFFSAVGLDSILLQATGTPILIKPTDFTVSFNQTSCSFTVNVADSTGTGLGGDPGTGGGTGSGDYGSTFVDPSPASANSWKYTDSSNNVSHSGSITTITYGFTTPNQLVLVGMSADNTYNLEVDIKFPTSGIATGSYHVDGANGVIGSGNVANPTFEGYFATGDTKNEENDSSYVNITSYNSSTKVITASFRCWATKTNADGTDTPALLRGSFNGKVQ